MEQESKVGGTHSSWLTSCSGTGWTTGRRMEVGVPKRLPCCSGKGIHPLWPGGSVFQSEGTQAFLFRQLLLKRMVKHPTEQIERGMKLTRNQKKKKKAAPGFYFLKYILGMHLHMKSLKMPLLCTVSSGDGNVQGKDTFCQRRRVIREKNHCSVLPFSVSEMFPPTGRNSLGCELLPWR